MSILYSRIHPEKRFSKTTEYGRRLVSKRGGENKKGLFTREKSGHHVSDIASCFYLVFFSKRANISHVLDDDLWLRCSCLISFFEKKIVMILYLNG